LAMFPPSRSVTPWPFPPQGPGGYPFPWFDGTMAHSDVLTSFPPHFVFLRLAVPSCASVFVPPTWPDAGQGAWSFAEWQPHATSRMETTGTPRFLENPIVPMPCSLTPAGPLHLALPMQQHGPRSQHDEGSQQEVISGLNRTALALAVYASPGGLPAQDAR